MVLPTSLYLLLASVSIVTQLINACPTVCKCHKTNETYVVTCANQSLASLPPGFSEDVTALYAQGNSISSLNNVFQNNSELLNLDLSFNKLQEIHLLDFNELSDLNFLNLQNNSITEIHPRAFSSTKQLVTLNLANNLLESISAAIFSGLNYLTILDLHGNFICNISNKAFLYTDSLISLDLSHNLIRDLPSTVFETLGRLETLNLAYNHLYTPDDFMVKDLVSLHYADLSHNQIEQFPNVSLSKLKYLDLSWNNISILEGSSGLTMSSILTLILNANPVENISGSAFKQLHSIKNLSLSHLPNLHYLSGDSFADLQNLTMLNVSHNPQLSFIHQNLFLPLQSLTHLDLSYNNITMLIESTLSANEQITSLDIKGNAFHCDCAIEWLVNKLQQNNSIIVNKHEVLCMMPNSSSSASLYSIDTNELHCSEVKIVNFTSSMKAKIGKSVRFICQASSYPTAEIVWITPRKKVLEYHKYHPFSIHEHLPVMDQEAQARFHAIHDYHAYSSYYSESESREDRITIMQDGSLYIDYVLRSDAGPYICEAKNPRNSTSVVINFTLDYQIINQVKIWSIIVGAICAGSFFLLNLIYSLALAGVRKCVSQRRREQIRTVIESMEQYKTEHLTRIKGNYSLQVGRIRDQYHYQLGRLREHHHNKMGRIREGASQKVERMRENYNNQLGKLKDYSSNQLVLIRDKYNNQILRIKDYGSDKFMRLHEKYKLKQQHVIKLLEMMNLDNCRTVFESECVRTESMILQSDILNVDEVGLHSPGDSESVSESEYMTATNSETSSNENIYQLTQINIPIPSGLSGTEVETSEGKYVLNDEAEFSEEHVLHGDKADLNDSQIGAALELLEIRSSNEDCNEIVSTQEFMDPITDIACETGSPEHRKSHMAISMQHDITNIKESVVWSWQGLF